MKGEEFRKMREKLEMTREEFASFLGLSGYQSVMNIEINFRKSSKFTSKILRYLDELNTKKAKNLIEEINRYEK